MAMSKIEKLLRISADSHKMPGWNDSLSYVLGREEISLHALTDEQLDMVAGGVDVPEEKIRILKERVFGHE